MRYYLFCFLIISFSSYSQYSEQLDSLYSKKFETFRKYKTTIHGQITNHCLIHTIYVFDSQNDNIYGLVNQLIHFQYNEINPILVVGIISENRNSDFLKKSELKTDNEQYGSDMGKYEDFDLFVSTELIPTVEEKFPTSQQRWAIGHSNAGTFLINQWLKKPELFSARLLIDPNFIFLKNQISRDIEGITNPEKYNQSEIYICRAFYPQSPIEWSSESKKVISSIKKLFGKTNHFKFENFEKEFNHYSVFSAACQNGLSYIFSKTLFEPEYFLNYNLKNCTSIEEKNTFALNYLLSMEFRGYNDFSTESAKFIDKFYQSININSLDVLTNFKLASRFEKLKLNKSSLLLYENCSNFIKQNQKNMKQTEFENYNKIIDNKIAILKSKVK